MALLYELFRTPVQVRIIEELLKNPDEYFTINRMARLISASPSAVSARISKLHRLGVVRIISENKAKVFSLNKDSKIVEILLELFEKLRELEAILPS